MSELEDKLNSILSSPEEMEKVSKMAQSLFGGEAGKPEPAAKNLDLASLAQMLPKDLDLGSLGGMLPEGLDAGMLGKVMSSFGGQKSGNMAMLDAIRPHLAEKRQAKLAKAMQISKMAKIAQIAFTEGKD